MDNIDDSENAAKVSDSAYSNSCSNSQSRRSHSSKSTHSGSNSSGSSGYGGKPSTSGSSNTLEQTSIKKKLPGLEVSTAEEPKAVETQSHDTTPANDEPKETTSDVAEKPAPVTAMPEQVPVATDASQEKNISKPEDMSIALQTISKSDNLATLPSSSGGASDGFSCVISMHDGVVMYATSSLTSTLGFPKDMWIGRSFIDFVHPRDRTTFASQITDGLAIPKVTNETPQDTVQTANIAGATMICRIRRYRGLRTGFGIKERVVSFVPFLLKFTFKTVTDENGKVIYLVIQATPFYSAYKYPNEVIKKPVQFVVRHAADGKVEFIDPDSVPYLGYLPQDVKNRDALQMYHSDDLSYLRQIYEDIVREGGVPRSKPYRLMAQNGDYVKVETEWSSFINPWSMKLEFVICKHQILEGPTNPDVFQSPELNKQFKICDEERHRAQMNREMIIRIMNDILTKPARAARQQMNKRCKDLAMFMDNLMGEPCKDEEELRLEIQEGDHSYERDTEMLGGISPHHEYDDSKSSTETPLSYSQINYNENLQRFFDSYLPHNYEDFSAGGTNNPMRTQNLTPEKKKSKSPVAHQSDSLELSSCDSSEIYVLDNKVANYGDYRYSRLTESLLNKHNAVMEKELIKIQRESRPVLRGEREKASNELKQKKKEHLARCNASFQPTLVGARSVGSESPKPRTHGVKRSSKQTQLEGGAQKQRCSSPRQSRCNQIYTTASAPVTSNTIHTHTSLAATWPACHMGNMNTYIVGVGMPQMPIMSALPTVSGVYPMYYAPMGTPTAAPSNPNMNMNVNMNMQPQYPAQPMPCMMYGQPVYGQPLMYSPIAQQVTYGPPPANVMTQQPATLANTLNPLADTLNPLANSLNPLADTLNPLGNTLNPLGLTGRNFEEACKTSVPLNSSKSPGASLKERRRTEMQLRASRRTARSSSNALDRSTEAVPDASEMRDDKSKTGTSGDDVVDKTDGESSYSSFYSSFFKTESGSAEESDPKRDNNETGQKEKYWTSRRIHDESKYYQSSMDKVGMFGDGQRMHEVAKRKAEPPWMEQVCVTSQLIYRYQVLTKGLDEVLLADREKLKTLEQPALVNEQLGQLYMDLKLEGVTARLSLEEGITSSSSSGEEASPNTSKSRRRKRQYNRLSMIYEEDAPLPSPDNSFFIPNAVDLNA